MKSIDAIVGSNLVRLRLLRGLSQAELGRAAGVSRSQISKFETGAVFLYAGSLYRLAMALEVPIVSFFDGLPLPNSPEAPDLEIDHVTMLDLISLLKAYHSLPETGKKLIQKQIRKTASIQ